MQGRPTRCCSPVAADHPAAPIHGAARRGTPAMSQGPSRVAQERAVLAGAGPLRDRRHTLLPPPPLAGEEDRGGGSLGSSQRSRIQQQRRLPPPCPPERLSKGPQA